jgi:hypothetical protein
MTDRLAPSTTAYFLVAPPVCAHIEQTGIDPRFRYCRRCGTVLSAPTHPVGIPPPRVALMQGTFAPLPPVPIPATHHRNVQWRCAVLTVRELCAAWQTHPAPTLLTLQQIEVQGMWVLCVRATGAASDLPHWHLLWHPFPFDPTTGGPSEAITVAFAPFAACVAALPSDLAWVGLYSAITPTGPGLAISGTGSPRLLPAALPLDAADTTA